MTHQPPERKREHEGFCAFVLEGKSRGDCPFERGTPEAEAWLGGFDAARRGQCAIERRDAMTSEE